VPPRDRIDWLLRAERAFKDASERYGLNHHLTELALKHLVFVMGICAGSPTREGHA
jgi:hypothetical protein